MPWGHRAGLSAGVSSTKTYWYLDRDFLRLFCARHIDCGYQCGTGLPWYYVGLGIVGGAVALLLGSEPLGEFNDNREPALWDLLAAVLQMAGYWVLVCYKTLGLLGWPSERWVTLAGIIGGQAFCIQVCSGAWLGTARADMGWPTEGDRGPSVVRAKGLEVLPL